MRNISMKIDVYGLPADGYDAATDKWYMKR